VPAASAVEICSYRCRPDSAMAPVRWILKRMLMQLRALGVIVAALQAANSNRSIAAKAPPRTSTGHAAHQVCEIRVVDTDDSDPNHAPIVARETNDAPNGFEKRNKKPADSIEGLRQSRASRAARRMQRRKDNTRHRPG